ncbi:MAG: hypothetical protein JXA42_25495 [Anaerolineales bacterium]|nr:hypothetical protein [Anaerolineales bacterium]
MDKPQFYEIRVQGRLTDRWSDWFGDLSIRPGPDGETILSGDLPDQAALLGVLNKIHGLNVGLISVSRKHF